MDFVVGAPIFPRLGETLLGEDFHLFPGGKGANQSVAAARLGCQTVLVGTVGEDWFGRQLIDFLESEKVDVTKLQVGKTQTGIALVLLHHGENAIIVSPGANHDRFYRPASSELCSTDVLVTQLELPLTEVESFLAAGRHVGAATILNAAPAIESARDIFPLSDYLIVNEHELASFAESSSSGGLASELARRIQSHDKQSVIVTLGRRGAIALHDGQMLEVAGFNVPVVDTTGAGDCFVGAFAAAIASEAGFQEALRYANAAAACAVQRKGAGTAMPTAIEVERLLRTRDG